MLGLPAAQWMGLIRKSSRIVIVTTMLVPVWLPGFDGFRRFQDDAVKPFAN